MVIDSEAPMGVTQTRTHFQRYITDLTKKKIEHRDMAREVARTTKDPDEWQIYRALRNACTRLHKSDKSNHLKGMYKKLR